MPPPTLFDPWLSSRRFGIVIDAGSSGSRIQLYSWRDARVLQLELDTHALEALPSVEKGTKDPINSVLKIEPGLSTFGGNPEGIFEYLKPLVEHAKGEIPPHLHAETPIFLLATAGMRLLPERQQEAVLKKVCQYLRDYTSFKVDKSGTQGPCGGSVRVISGEEEGLFGWIAVNYLMEGFSSGGESRQTYGFLDMGGASTQIAFEPKDDTSHDLIPVRLRLLNGEDITHKIFTTTWLGYGTNQARERYVGRLIEEFERRRTHSLDIVPDPCLPLDLERTETPVHMHSVSDHAQKSHLLVGSGNFTKCLEESAPLLNKDMPCVQAPCLFGGKRVPKIDFSVTHFIGVSEYWYSSEQIFNLGGAYDFAEYGQAADHFCKQEWSAVVAHHALSHKQGEVGGDGELEQDGTIVGMGYWGPDVELARLELQCFKAAWIVNVLHEGLGMPRIVDPGGNSTDHSAADQVDHNAGGKGLGRPTFQSADTVRDTAITWTLGKMVLEASKEIASSTGVHVPLPDPLHANTGLDASGDAPGMFDYGLSKHLPKSLHGRVLGIPVGVSMIYIIFLIFLIMLASRWKKPVRMMIRRFTRRANARTDREDVFEMQDDGPAYNYSSPTTPSPLPAFARSILSRFQTSSAQHSSNTPFFANGTSTDGGPHRNEAVANGRSSSRQEGIYGNGIHGGSPRSDRGGLNGGVGAKALYSSLSTLTQNQNSSSSLNLYPRSTASLVPRSGAQTPVRQIATEGEG